MVKAPCPKLLLHGSLVSLTLAGVIINVKYVNAVPLYRLEKEFERYGLAITRQNEAAVKNGGSAKLKEAFIYALNQEKYLQYCRNCQSKPVKAV